jgi:hypothetical protein
MKRFLFRLASAVKQLGMRRPSSRGPLRVHLEVEGMEERLALSTSPVGLPGEGIALPDMVCGYKHRGRCGSGRPWIQPGQVVSIMSVDADLLAAAGVFSGGADGTLVSISANHPLTVTPPLGPLPMDLLAADGL